eukprot:132735-Chlamydomonas_euryale.AAC.7
MYTGLLAAPQIPMPAARGCAASTERTYHDALAPLRLPPFAALVSGCAPARGNGVPVPVALPHTRLAHADGAAGAAKRRLACAALAGPALLAAAAAGAGGAGRGDCSVVARAVPRAAVHARHAHRASCLLARPRR